MLVAEQLAGQLSEYSSDCALLPRARFWVSAVERLLMLMHLPAALPLPWWITYVLQ